MFSIFKKKDFTANIEKFNDLRSFSLVLPREGVSSEVDLATHLLISLNSFADPLLLGFFSTSKITFLYFASSSDSADAVAQEISTRYPKTRLSEISLDEIRRQVNEENELSGSAYFYSQTNNKHWLPIKTSRSFSIDPLASLFSAAKRLESKELLWLQIALLPARSGRDSDFYKALLRVPKSEDLDGSLRASIEKLEQPLFLTQIVAAARSSSQSRFQSLIDAFESFFGQFDGYNSIRVADNFYKTFGMKRETSVKVFRDIFMSGAIIPGGKDEWIDSLWSIFSAQEIASLWHIPHKSLALPPQMVIYSEEEIIATEQIKNWKSRAPGAGVLIGCLRADLKFDVKLDEKCRYTPQLIIGGQGMGKGSLMANMIQQDMENGSGVGLIDPAGDLADRILGLVPSNRVKDVILIDVADPNYSVGINLLQAVKPEDYLQRNLIIDNFINLVRKLSPEELGSAAESVLNVALTVLTQCKGANFVDLDLFLNDGLGEGKEKVYPFQQKMFKLSGDDEVEREWNLLKKQMGDAIGILNKRLRPLKNPLILSMLGQSESSLNLREAMDSHKIVLINIAKGKVGQEAAQLLGSLFSVQFLSAALSRADIVEHKRHRFYLYLDEFQNFNTPAISIMMDEARKYGLSLIMACQGLSQLEGYVVESIKSNGKNIIAFKGGDDTVFKKWFLENSYQILDRQGAANLQLFVDNSILPGQPILTPDYPLEDKSMTLRIRQLVANYAKSRSEVLEEIKTKRQIARTTE